MGGPVNELRRPPRGPHDLAVGLDQAAIEGLRAMIRAGGAGQLAVGDLRDDDLAGLAWSGNPAHLRSVAAARNGPPRAWRITWWSGHRAASRSPR